MKLFKSIDEKFEEIGFKKISENKHGASYERYDKEYEYNQRLDLCYKVNGNHIIQSYDETNTTKDYSPVVGLTAYEMKLALKKMKQLFNVKI